jgi:hypothetical protein
MDFAERTAYVPVFNGPSSLEAIDLRSKDRRKVLLSARYYSAKISPSRERLVLSGADLDPSPAVATLDIPGLSNEKRLPVVGSDAAWLGDDTILFVRSESELWRYRIGDAAPVRLFVVETNRSTHHGSFAKPPIVSPSRRLIAWGLPMSGDKAPELRTIVVDLERGEYRLLEGWWHNMQWLE